MEPEGEHSSKPFVLSYKPLEYLSIERPPPSPPTRRIANYPPSLWDDFYIQSLQNNSLDEAQVDLWEKLREEIKQLIGKQEDVKGQLEFIDAMGQLGVSYHFQEEIKNSLGFITSSYGSLNNKLSNNLYVNTLLFRLLREQDLETSHLSLGDLLQSLKSDYESSELTTEEYVKCILGLYEACFLAVGGEDEADEAIENLTKHLVKFREKQLSAFLREQIDHALELPLHWRMPRLHTRWFIDTYEKQENMNPKMLQFAKLDFNLLQSIYKKELKEMSRWWKNLGLTSFEISFARDRLVENYLWAIGCSYEPQFWRCRMNITKFGALLTTIDDVYDVYGSLDELQLFTTAIIDI
ncbi:hypothetical protein HPP92_023996 [Vanilla planifolia]|uniref:Uncharacterized protein n=1 Tax=Vanilla planifolia TaxID=51239 RepID=A0A835PNX8_VANPL|nr:hypothetical protein HPP92_023996 [Vanilla planifolia]